MNQGEIIRSDANGTALERRALFQYALEDAGKEYVAAERFQLIGYVKLIVFSDYDSDNAGGALTFSVIDEIGNTVLSDLATLGVPKQGTPEHGRLLLAGDYFLRLLSDVGPARGTVSFLLTESVEVKQ